MVILYHFLEMHALFRTERWSPRVSNIYNTWHKLLIIARLCSWNLIKILIVTTHGYNVSHNIFQEEIWDSLYVVLGLVKWRNCYIKCVKIKLMKGKAVRKHSLNGKIAASILLKLFISGNEKCHTTDVP